MVLICNRNGYLYIYGNFDYILIIKLWSLYYINGNQYLEFCFLEFYYVIGFDIKGDIYSNFWVIKIKFLFYNDIFVMWVCRF